jgi:N-acylneuraminate cytidylyltransferase
MTKKSRSETIAIIPARGGSSRIPRKNIAPLSGKPVIAYTIAAALAARRVDRTIVSTDDPEIARVSRDLGAEAVRRPARISGGTAPSEAALLHALDQLQEREGRQPGLVVFLQCTSPVRRDGDIDRAVETFESSGADSLFSASRSRCFLWRLGPDGPVPLNYDYRKRIRDQDFAPEYVENGSLYVFRPEFLRRTNNRLGGKIAVYEMDPWSSLELDDPEDIAPIEWALARASPRERLVAAARP